MLMLSPPAWADEWAAAAAAAATTIAASSTSTSTSTSSSSSPSSSTACSSAVNPVSDLVSSLTQRRLYREIALALRTAIADAKADFSFLRVKGLKALLKLLSIIAKSEALIPLFQDSQTDATLQVVPALFAHSLTPSRGMQATLLEDHVCSEKPTQVISPPTDYEVALALRVLEGCCLLDIGSRFIASQHMAVKEVIELLSAGGILEQGACLDALPALMLGTPENQQEFLRHQGLVKISDFVKNGHADERMRLKCAEFLLLLVGSLLPHATDHLNDNLISAEDAQQELQELLEIDFMPVIHEADQMLISFSDNLEKENELQLQAKQLLDLIDAVNW